MATQFQVADILQFWYSDRVRDLWFNSTAEFDAELRSSYRSLWLQAAEEELSAWQQSAEGSVALAIILDQFPLNMFRGKPLAFATEAHARNIARKVIESGADTKLSNDYKIFLYMPFMHSEILADQQLAIELYSKAGMEDNTRFARHHCDIVQRFGRFPHRNAILGRTSSAEEIVYLNSDEGFHG